MTQPTNDTDDAGVAVRMQNRLQRMGEAERAEHFTLMERGEDTRRVMTQALGATREQLRELLDMMEIELLERRERRD